MWVNISHTNVGFCVSCCIPHTRSLLRESQYSIYICLFLIKCSTYIAINLPLICSIYMPLWAYTFVLTINFNTSFYRLFDFTIYLTVYVISPYISVYISLYISLYISRYTLPYISPHISPYISWYTLPYISPYISRYTSPYISPYNQLTLSL